LYVVSNVGTVISVADRTPRTICAAIEKHRVELLPVTPSFLHLLIASGEYKQRDLSSLRVITYGTEVMPQATLDQVRALFPDVQLQQTYGLSELGVLRTKSREDGSLWVKVGGEGFQTKVVNSTLWIKAESAMIGYLNAPQPFDDEGWFNTQDRVEVDGDYLRILGRDSEIINVAGQKVFPSEVENVLIQVDNVTDAVVRSEKNVLVGNIVVATLTLGQPEEAEQLKRRVKEFCKGRLAPYKIPQKIEISEDVLFNTRFKRIRGEPRPQ
jgi:acyl-CoA synthetase (AMP-forming)/AMP-acid ligase II